MKRKPRRLRQQSSKRQDKSFFINSTFKKTYHTAVVHEGKFTFFFIPLFPIGKKYMIICNLCGRKLQAVADLERQLSNWEQTGQLRSA